MHLEQLALIVDDDAIRVLRRVGTGAIELGRIDLPNDVEHQPREVIPIKPLPHARAATTAPARDHIPRFCGMAELA